MPSRQNASRIDPAVWESYRTEIRNYYLLEDRSLGDLIPYMKEKYNLHATKAQYERQFVLWKFRKNLTSDEWGFAIDRIEKRKREGKENDLFVDGIKVPTKRIKKEISRRRWPDEIDANEQVQTPEGISVRTPQAHTAFNFTGSLENLPWFKFQHNIESRVSIGQVLSSGNTSRLERGPPSLAQLGSSLQETETLPIPVNSVSTLVRPSPSLPETMAEQDPIRNIPSISQLPAAILESRDSMTLHGYVNQQSLLQVVKFALYLASNNLLSDELAKKFLRFIIESKQESALASLFKERMPTIEAFAEFAFKHALYIQNANILRICLQAGVDPNRRFETANRRRYTPLEISMYVCGNVELTKVLLDAGAHTNLLSILDWNQFSSTSLAALTALFDTELAQTLLEISVDINGAYCWGGAVLTAAAVGNVEPIHTLFKVGVSVKSIGEWSEIALVAAAGNRDMELVQTLLKSGVDIDTYNDSPMKPSGTALCVATACGHIGLVRVLLDAGADVDFSYPGERTALQTAADQNNLHLARILLDAGADVEGLSEMSTLKAALHIATERGNIEMVQLLLGAGASANAPPSEGGRTALQAAAEIGNTRLVQVLLDAGANVNAAPVGGDGGTALQAAVTCEWGGIDIVPTLLRAGADVNAPASLHGSTALQAAAASDRGSIFSLVPTLLRAGADVNAPASRYGSTALQAAATQGNINLVRVLLDAGADANAPASRSGVTALQAAAGAEYCVSLDQFMDHYYGDEGTPSQSAIEDGNIELVQALLDAGADINAPPGQSQNTALQAATRRGDTELVRILVRAGADVNAPAPSDDYEYGYTALQFAARDCDFELVQILLDKGADVNTPAGGGGMTALQGAVRSKGHQNIELVQILLQAGANVNAPPGGDDKTTVLQAAAGLGNIELVRILLNAGADVNYTAGGEKRTALHIAVSKGDIRLVRTLLDAGADVNTPSKLTALQEAAIGNRIELAQILLDAGADINAPATKFYGRTALQGAALSGSTKMVKFLLNKNADVNALPAPAGGVTALQGAAIAGHLAIAILLLQAGAEVNAAPAMFKGRSALEGAAENGRLDMVQLLLDVSAETGNLGGTNLSKAAALAKSGEHHVVAKLLRDYSN